MGAQEFRTSYRVAFEQANVELEEIFNEYDWLQLRKEQIESVLLALQPFVAPVSNFQHTINQPTPIVAPSAPVEPPYEISKAAFHPEPAREPLAAAFTPASEAALDPIQARINRALGLAVA